MTEAGNNGAGVEVIDPEYKASVSITGFHYQTHLGKAYIVSHKFSAVADDAVADIYVKVPADFEPHIVFHRDIEGDADVELFEDTTVSADGTALTAYNLNRNSANTSAIEFFYTPTVTLSGTQLFLEWNAAGAGGQAAGSEGTFDEFELAKGKNYLFRVTNRSGGAKNIGIFARYYEV